MVSIPNHQKPWKTAIAVLASLNAAEMQQTVANGLVRNRLLD
jgi:hypothetical protein